ncbi:hypothetical protein [Vibrio nigripulchritudo]|uniref:hypothetical protein n=1 Tax=Vibrio nigripulchritudo TaxID=28173 RepID=UPI00249279CE|nr:hypothetical protein [Vibrio nigripulchritudo]BDU41050.1 hypothetical protein TUMSATVNIG2_55190 [Vibrio nigripulchritudo]BDU46790.1 hypothetical protein TUMSATVNIG3_55880 [Vibrio nigripulchritudo]
MSPADRYPLYFTTIKPCGIRNNNQWTEQTSVELLGRFATFSHMKYGIRADVKLIKNYMTRYSLITVFDIINR